MISILLIDDEQEWLRSFSRTLLTGGIVTEGSLHTASCWEDAKAILGSEKIDLVFLDLILGDDSGEECLEYIMGNYTQTSVVIMSGADNIQSAVKCMKLGALDYFNKALSLSELILNVKRVIKMVELQQENISLKNNILSKGIPDFEGFITVNPSLTALLKYLTSIAFSSRSILITGESGTGKSMLAKAVAKYSRPAEPFVSVNVAGLDQHMFTDTLFGHVKGAFTGAETARTGMIQKAGAGTILLDEIGELPVPSQLTLLYITQSGEYQPLGSDNIKQTAARFIFATNQDMEEKCRTGQFRRDLYYRLKTHHVHIPALRERRDDIPLLLNHFIADICAELNKSLPAVDDSALSFLLNYDFPGNVREMHAMIFDIIAKSTERKITGRDFEKFTTPLAPKVHLTTDILNESERRLPSVDELILTLIHKAMELAGGNQRKAATLIGLSQPTLSRRLKGKS